MYKQSETIDSTARTNQSDVHNVIFYFEHCTSEFIQAPSM